MRIFRSRFAILLAMSLLSCATPATTGNVRFEVPRGWYTKSEGDGLAASPDPNLGLPLLSVEACERTDPACSTPCDATKVQANFFFFSTADGQFTFSQRPWADGGVDFGVIGTIPAEGGAVQVSSRVLCSDRGIVFLSLMSKGSLEQLSLLQSIVETVRWRSP